LEVDAAVFQETDVLNSAYYIEQLRLKLNHVRHIIYA